MPEYINVEKPFLEKLEQIGWQIIDHGPFGIPSNPRQSLRSSFKEVVLKDTLKNAVRDINRTEDGNTWLTDAQLEALYREVTENERMAISLHEANKSVFNLLQNGTTVSENERTGESNPKVHFIDYKNWGNNSFIAINQFRVNTPAGPREAIIPDIVLFVNGLPFVVVECKDLNVSEPLSEAYNQIKRYANSRDDDFGVKEGEERLFHYNLFSIATHGEEARFGSITAEFEHFLNWKDIFPEEYKVIEIKKYDPDQHDKEPAMRQEVMIRGMLNKEILIDVFRHFSLFMEIKEGTEVKIISRYPQYRAVGKMIERIRLGELPRDRSGVIWHTQGSGKSLTMVFLIRKLRSLDDLKDRKVIMVNDRADLEDQLAKTAAYTNEKVGIVNKRRDLRDKLSDDSSDLHLVMLHKFIEEEIRHSKALMKAYVEEGEVPEFKPFEVINRSDKVLILIDEAHRTQGGEMGDNLFAAFPNASKMAFTGTPLLTERHKLKTHERFGPFIDKYKIRESVRDRATLDIVYIGRTSKDKITDADEFRRDFEDVFAKQSKEEQEEIQRRYGGMREYLENMDRLREISRDIVDHYVTDILPNGFKAQVVASSVLAAARYENLILEAIREKTKEEKNKSDDGRDDELIKKLEFLDVCTAVTKQDNNEIGYVTRARKKAKEKNAIDNFKKDFDFNKPETGIAFLCVCDRLLTGFDAPVEQVMYLDKNLREHDLMQTIARVNRTKKDKTHGIVVDYYGVANHLKDALQIYGDKDEKDLNEYLEYFRDINKEIPVLEARYKRMIQLFEDKGVSDFEAFANQTIEDKKHEFEIAEKCIELAEGLPFRAQFDTYLKAFFDSLDLLFNIDKAKQFWIPAKRFGYLLIRIRNRYKDTTLDLKWAKPKVRQMIDKHLESLGIDSKIPPVSILSDDFSKEVDKHAKTPRAKASEMEHAIRRHIKINMQKDPALFTKFDERMKAVMKRYKDNWEIIVTELQKIKEELKKGREADQEEGLNKQELPFYEMVVMNAYADTKIKEEDKERTKELIINCLSTIKQTIDRPNFWRKKAQVRALEGEIDDMLDYCGIEEISASHQRICTEILALAKIRHDELTSE